MPTGRVRPFRLPATAPIDATQPPIFQLAPTTLRIDEPADTGIDNRGDDEATPWLAPQHRGTFREGQVSLLPSNW